MASRLLCGICMESKNPNEIFSELHKCSTNHTYCNDCMATYLTSKIEEKISLISCPNPNCENKIEPQNCSTILPKEVFERWEIAICESLILESQKYYCPFNDCSALMENDATEVVRQAECPSCRRLFCAHCRVPWHVGLTCEEFMTCNEDDCMAIKLANDKEWRRCSNCNFYVEKNEGCLHITCRCSYQFCYKCGKGWNGHRC